MGNCGKQACCQLCAGNLERFFGESDTETLTYLKDGQEVYTFKKGEVLFEEGTPSTGLFCILRGNIKLCKGYNSPKERIINLLKPGELMGVHSVIVERNFTKTAIALEDVKVCHLPKEILFTVIEMKPAVVVDLLRHVEKGISEIQGRATQILQLPTEERMIGFLLMLHQKFQEGSNGSISISLSPKDFANLLHTTRATVYRLFKKLEEAKLIQVNKHDVTLLNIPKMKLIAGA
jgi:CRP/FNR family transcriptional regulator, polysaccharide utilization system transcription regulator